MTPAPGPPGTVESHPLPKSHPIPFPMAQKKTPSAEASAAATSPDTTTAETAAAERVPSAEASAAAVAPEAPAEAQPEAEAPQVESGEAQAAPQSAAALIDALPVPALPKQMHGAVPVGDRTYKPGEEAALEAVLGPKQCQYLKDRRVITGTWNPRGQDPAPIVRPQHVMSALAAMLSGQTPAA